MKRAVLLLALPALLLAAPSASAATIYVDQTAPTGGGSCGSPDYNSAQAAVNAAGDGDTVLLCLSGTPYPGNVVIGNKSLVIQGEGTANTVIDGDGKRFGFLGQSSGKSLTLRDLKIRNGSDGGWGERGAGVTVNGPLTVENVVLDGNSGFAGGGIFNNTESAPTIIRDSVISDNRSRAGGGLNTSGSVEVYRSVFHNNAAETFGGAIQAFTGNEPVIIEDSTFSSNTSRDSGAIDAFTIDVRDSTFKNNSAAMFDGEGGALNASSRVTLTNSTFSNNSAKIGSAVITYIGDIDVLNSTIVDNPTSSGLGGGALITDEEGLIAVGNSVIAQNGIGCKNFHPSPGLSEVVNGGGNVITTDTTGCDKLVGPVAPAPTTKVTRSALSLSPLADNGGPTETMALGSTSVALGAALAAGCPALDQRGYLRQPNDCDSGAFQRDAAPPISSYQLSVSKVGSGEGLVDADTGSLDCGPRCSDEYEDGTIVTLTATPNIGSDFVGWSGAGCSGIGTCTVTMDQAQEVEADFVVSDWLRVVKDGSGTGTVTSNPAGISCGEVCDAEYEGDLVTLEASAEPGSTFVGWYGACQGSDPCVIDFSETNQAQVGATFKLERLVSVVKRGSGAGTVTSDPGGIACGSICSAEFQSKQVTLHAEPKSHSLFAGWSAAGCSTDPTCKVDLSNRTQASLTPRFLLRNQVKPTLSRGGSAGLRRIRVRVACSIETSCLIRLFGSKRGSPKAKLLSRRVSLETSASKTVVLQTSKAFRRVVKRGWRRSKRPRAVVTAEQIGAGRKRLSLPVKRGG